MKSHSDVIRHARLCRTVADGWQLFARLQVDEQEQNPHYAVARMTFYSGAALVIGLWQRLDAQAPLSPEARAGLLDDLAREVCAFFEAPDGHVPLDWRGYLTPRRDLRIRTPKPGEEGVPL